MKIKFGAIVTDGRGKLGGHVASKNRGGSYLRTKVTPSNPQTVYQTEVRQQLAEFAQGWRALTEDQRNAWNAAVPSFQKTDIFGDLKQPSGINLYVKLNQNLAEVGISPIDTPPLPGEVVGPQSVTLAVDESAGEVIITWTGGNVPSFTSWVARLTPQVSPGQNFLKNKFRNINVIAAATASGVDVGTDYIARFGALTVGQKIGLEIVAVNTQTGQKGAPLSTTTIVVA